MSTYRTDVDFRIVFLITTCTLCLHSTHQWVCRHSLDPDNTHVYSIVCLHNYPQSSQKYPLPHLALVGLGQTVNTNPWQNTNTRPLYRSGQACLLLASQSHLIFEVTLLEINWTLQDSADGQHNYC